MDREFIAERQRGLQNYLNVIMANHVLSNCELLKKFLDPNNYSANYTGKKQGLWGAVTRVQSSARDNIWESSTSIWGNVHICNRIVFLCKDFLDCIFLYIFRRGIISFQNIFDACTEKTEEKQLCLYLWLPIIFSLEQSRQPTAVVHRATSIWFMFTVWNMSAFSLHSF